MQQIIFLIELIGIDNHLVETGWLETVELDEVGLKVRVKFDTGNGSKACALHADKILSKMVRLLNGHMMVKLLVNLDMVKSEVFRSNAELDEPSETRPTVSNEY